MVGISISPVLLYHVIPYSIIKYGKYQKDNFVILSNFIYLQTVWQLNYPEKPVQETALFKDSFSRSSLFTYCEYRGQPESLFKISRNPEIISSTSKLSASIILSCSIPLPSGSLSPHKTLPSVPITRYIY